MNNSNNYDDNDSENSELSESEERNLENIISIFPKREIRRENEQADRLTFERIKQLLSCPICLEIFKDPVFVKECMHRFCKGCIEKIIRGNHKTCPTCRKAIGSKRELRSDLSTVSTNYLEKEDDYERELLQRTFKDGFLRTSKKSKTQKKQVPEIPAHSMEEEAEIGDLRRKKRKGPQKKETLEKKISDASHRLKTEEEENLEEKKDNIEEEFDEDVLMYLSELHKQGQTLEYFVDKTEWLVTIKLEPLPTSYFLPFIENNMIRTNSVLKISQLCGYICREMNLKEAKYLERISIYIKMEDFVKVEHQRSLGDLLKNEWKENRQVGVTPFNFDSFLQEIAERVYLKDDTTRILYYHLDLDDWLES